LTTTALEFFSPMEYQHSNVTDAVLNNTSTHSLCRG
jgi:hypothetical protein